MQRVTSAHVEVTGEVVGRIGPGLLVLVGVSHDDEGGEAAWLADKLIGLRIFPDHEGKMNRTVKDIAGEVLLVSQFTLYGDARKGRRPSFIRAARGSDAEALYERVGTSIAAGGVPCSTGVFGAVMKVSLVNDGPVTILLDSDKAF